MVRREVMLKADIQESKVNVRAIVLEGFSEEVS